MKKLIYIFLLAVLPTCSQHTDETESELVYSMNSVFSRQGEKMAVSDQDGNILTPHEFDDLEGLSNGNILAYKGETFYLLKPDGTPANSTGFEEFTYCFNGCAIVKDSLGFGVVSLSGKMLVPTQYDFVRFITPRLAAAIRGGHTTIVDCYGNAIAQTVLPMDSVMARIPIYDQMFEEKHANDHTYWNNILDSYETLCEMALEVKLLIKTDRGAAKKGLEQLMDEAAIIEDDLKGASGQMTPKQMERFRAIKGRYSNYEN